MRRVIVNNIVSLDGFYADPSGNPLALVMDGAFDRANLESIESADEVLLGRDSFEGFSSYWPFIADAPAPDDVDSPGARAVDETNRATSRRYNALPKIVVSDRGAIADDNVWAPSTTVIGRADVARWLTEETRTETTVLVFGSRRMWAGLLGEGLVDELHLMVSPVALGSGVPLFSEPTRLELADVRRFPDSSNVQLRYRVPSARSRR